MRDRPSDASSYPLRESVYESWAVHHARQKSLKDAELKEQLQQLRRTDNFTNWYYLVRTYLFLRRR